MARKNKAAIDLENSRYGLFMNNESYDLELTYGRHFLETDVKFIVKIYRINIIKTKSHDLYGQTKANDKYFFAPVDINAMLDVEDNEQINYGDDDGGITREDTGNLIFNVYLDELKEKNIEINRGDIVEYNFSGEKPRYYEVSNAQNVTDITSNSIANFKPYWKKIICYPVKEDVTPYLKGDSLT